jgi:ferredoxin
MSNAFIDHLNSFSETDWLAAVEELLPCIHEVDRNAVQIWFRFYPLTFHRYIAAAADREELVRGLALKGVFELKDQIDTSHHFLYGHRYWKKTKCVIENMSEPPASAGGQFDSSQSVTDLIKSVGMAVAKKFKVDRSLTNAIAAIGLMTLNQVGIEAFKAAPGEVAEPTGVMKKSPDAIVTERAKDVSQGLLGFLRTVDKKFRVNFTSMVSAGKFPIMIDEEIASASQKDREEDWQARDERCWEGPVPIECTSASCGTCWVGVLGGAEKLAAVKPRERRAMKVFGYNQPDDEKPFLRLACQARAEGNVTIVIPPWNGVFGKKVYGNVEDLELEPVTTSAKHLRELVQTAGSSESE